MGLSDYTQILKIKEKIYLFNSLYGTIDEIDKEFNCKIQEKSLKITEKNSMIKRNHFQQQSQYEELLKIGQRYIENDKITYNFYIIFSMRCNLNCTYCFQSKNKQVFTIKDETLEKILIRIKNMSSHKDIASKVILYGGEPLLNENKELILKTLEFCKINNIPVKVITNGINIDIFINILLEYKNIISEIIITLDGNENTHNANRIFRNKSGTYHKIMKNLNLLLYNEIEFILRVNLTNEIYYAIKNELFPIDEIVKCKKMYYRVHFENYSKNLKFKKILNLYLDKKINFDEIAVNPVKAFIYLMENDNILPLVRYCNRDRIKVFNQSEINVYNCTEIYDKSTLDDSYKFKYEECCKICKVLPLCGGGCSSESKRVENFEVCEIYKDIIEMIKFYIKFNYIE